MGNACLLKRTHIHPSVENEQILSKSPKLPGSCSFTSVGNACSIGSMFSTALSTTKCFLTNTCMDVLMMCAVVMDDNKAYSHYLFKMMSINIGSEDSALLQQSGQKSSRRYGLSNTLVTSRNSHW